MTLTAMLIFTTVFVFGMRAMAGEEPKKPDAVINLSQALQKIGAKFGAIIIADPGLSGRVPAEIRENTVEAALKSILEPLGYDYTKVEKYYLISGPQSPVTLFADTDSCLTPVGFIDPKTQARLGEYQRYLTYDPNLGVAYVKAPTLLLNKILEKLWRISQTEGRLSVVYHMQIIDLSQNSDLDLLFSGAEDSSQNGINQVIITPDKWSLNQPIRALIEDRAASNSNTASREPWLIVLPGKTARFVSNEHWTGEMPDLDHNFSLKVTPVQVDAGSGRVLSEIYIGRGHTIDSSLGTAKPGSVSTTNNAKGIDQPMSMVSTTVVTSPGQRQILAVVRQTSDAGQKWPFEKVKMNRQRYYAVAVTATPVNIQSSLAGSAGLVPVASLGGFDLEENEQQQEWSQKSFWEIGAGTKNLWTELGWAVSTSTRLKMEYKRAGLYDVGLSQRVDAVPAHQTSLELLAGEGVGPDKQAAVLLGFGDQTHPFGPLTLYATYYPWTYSFDSKDYSNQGVWKAGTRLESGKAATINLEASGNPDFDGWRLQFNLNNPKYPWVFRYDNRVDEKTTFGVGLHFEF